jgi:uncharacterized protein (TIGR02285 family)
MKHALSVIAAGLGLCVCAYAQAQAPITLYYNERPPYLMSQSDGSVLGLTATPAVNAFKKANIPFVWKKMPASRQLRTIQGNGAAECTVGWFKTAKREKFAKYTKAIYQDKPTVAIVRDEIAIPSGTGLESLLAERKLRLLVKANYSYGPYIDGLLTRLHAPVSATVAENATMVHMLKMGRADMMFMAEEEALELLPTLAHGGLKLLRFSDVPSGEKRYILCSKKVPDEIISRLNQQIVFDK